MAPSVADAVTTPPISLRFLCHFLAQWPHMLLLLTASIGVWRPLLCSGCEDTFNFASSTYSESWKCLGTYTPPPTPRQLWTVTDVCSNISTPTLWLLDSEVWLVALSLQQDWAKFTLYGTSSFHFFHFPIPLLVFLNILHNKPYWISSYSLFLRSWPKTALKYLKVQIIPRPLRSCFIVWSSGVTQEYERFILCVDLYLTVKEDIPLIYSLPLPTLFSWSIWLLLEHVSICPDTDELHPQRLCSHSPPPPPKLCRGCWSVAPSGRLTGCFLPNWKLLLNIFESWLSFNDQPINHCLLVSPLLGLVGSQKEQKADIFTQSLGFNRHYHSTQDGC